MLWWRMLYTIADHSICNIQRVKRWGSESGKPKPRATAWERVGRGVSVNNYKPHFFGKLDLQIVQSDTTVITEILEYLTFQCLRPKHEKNIQNEHELCPKFRVNKNCVNICGVNKMLKGSWLLPPNGCAPGNFISTVILVASIALSLLTTYEGKTCVLSELAEVLIMSSNVFVSHHQSNQSLLDSAMHVCRSIIIWLHVDPLQYFFIFFMVIHANSMHPTQFIRTTRHFFFFLPRLFWNGIPLPALRHSCFSIKSHFI